VTRFIDNLVVFGRMLRAAGLPVGTDRLTTLVDALQHIDLSSREDVRAAYQSVLLQRHEDIPAFQKLFDEFRFSAAGDTDDQPDLIELTKETVTLRTWSDLDRIADKDFAELSASERSMVASAFAGMTWNLDPRRTRRWAPGKGARIDLRRAIARSIRTNGEIAALPTRSRRLRRRSIVLLCDVSGSMEHYTRTLLLFAHALSASRRDVEAFLFSTRLTRITHELRAPKPDAAMTAVSHAVRDWSGGTRIGDALRAFHQRWRRRALHSSSIVILISDGWDRGDPGVLRDEIARLQRSCDRLIWLNPLIGTIDYAPLTQGLQAALPFVDDFLPVRTLRDVRELALHLTALDRRDPTGRRPVKLHGHYRHLHLHRPTGSRLEADAGSGADRVVHPGM
jgi:uncharacterized protein with von Willebrand factor type A (vWA) domain